MYMQKKLQFEGQSIQTTEWQQTDWQKDRQTDERTLLIALPTRSVNISRTVSTP